MVKEVKMIIGLIIILIGCAIGVAVVIRGFWENQNPVLTEYKIEKTGLPSNFKGFKIAHISDYHNTEIGKDNQKLLDLFKGKVNSKIVKEDYFSFPVK
jgi:predicted MPP superfamily phosphohydrolase